MKRYPIAIMRDGQDELRQVERDLQANHEAYPLTDILKGQVNTARYRAGHIPRSHLSRQLQKRGLTLECPIALDAMEEIDSRDCARRDELRVDSEDGYKAWVQRGELVAQKHNLESKRKAAKRRLAAAKLAAEAIPAMKDLVDKYCSERPDKTPRGQ